MLELGCVSSSFSSSSKSKKEKKKNMKYRPFAKTPSRFQQGGEFPMQLRPLKTPEVRDLNDASLDEEVSGPDRVYKPKPHRIREAVQSLQPGRLRGTEDDTAKVHSLHEKKTQVAAKVPHFNPEKDLNEEDAATLCAVRARALLKRNYKWMPNPFSSKPGTLGTDPKAEANYYATYFDGQKTPGDRRRPTPAGPGASEDYVEPGNPAPKRERISPKRFWIQPEHVTPDPHTVAFMNSRELKYAMVNEAYLVRRWRNEQPEGPAAGLPAGAAELWLAFGYRAAELACGRSIRPLSDEQTVQDEGDGLPKAKIPTNRCSLSTALRFLQAMASVQAGPFSALQQLVLRVLEHIQDLKPHQCFFLLQAMSRLRLRHPKATRLLQKLSLAWRALPDKKFIKAANAVAKLDLGSQLWAKPLKLALVAWIPKMTGRQLANIKAITVMELLDDPESMKVYLQQCEKLRNDIWYSRHLQMVELHVHLVYPDLWKSLDEHVRVFLQEVRKAAEGSRDKSSKTKARKTATAANSDEASDSDSSESEEAATYHPSSSSSGRSFDRRKFSSALHQDVSRILDSQLKISHSNQLAAGPLTVDMCHVETLTVLDAAARWAYFLRSAQMTALARRRQELLRAMGFKLVTVPYYRWEVLEDDAAKAAYLRDLLPLEVLGAQKGTDRTTSTSAFSSART